MSIKYDKLWALTKANKMTKKQLATAANLSRYMMTKLNKSQPVTMEVMVRFCKIFHCDIGDLMEVIDND